MDDIMEKLSELLSDEESVRQLSELAQIMSERQGDKADDGEQADFSGIMKLSGIMNSMKADDSNTELIAALKPHLKPERQIRADKAIKMLRMISAWNAAKDSGIINDLF